MAPSPLAGARRAPPFLSWSAARAPCDQVGVVPVGRRPARRVVRLSGIRAARRAFFARKESATDGPLHDRVGGGVAMSLSAPTLPGTPAAAAAARYLAAG